MEDGYSYAMQLCSSSVVPMVMQAVVELQVLEIIAKAGDNAQLSPSEIVSQMSATKKPHAAEMQLDRMLALLATHDILTCSVNVAQNGQQKQRVYGLRPVAKHFVPNQDGVSFGPLMSMVQNKVFMDCWYHLKGSILEGDVPFIRVHGMHAFDYAAKDSKFNEVFNEGNFNLTAMVLGKIIESYNGFENLTQIVDVGGGVGVTLKIITSTYPHIKGINFDLPHVVQHAPHIPGVEHVGGDMFESVPKGDAIFMKCILHGCDDEHCLKLLKSCHKAVPDDGKVIVVEGIVPEKPDKSDVAKYICQADMIVLGSSAGGKERTQQEFLALATGAGFAGIKLQSFNYNYWVIEFYKR